MAINGRTLGWVLFSLRLAASRAGLLAASMVTALVAATLLVIAAVLAPAVAEQTFRGTVDAVSPADNDIRATTAFDADSWDDIDMRLREVAAANSTVVAGVSGAAMTLAAQVGSDTPDELRIALGAVRDVEAHAELADGRWPQPGERPVEVVVHTEALSRLGVSVGDAVLIDLLTSDSALDAVVVGSYAPLDPDHSLWRGLGRGFTQDDGDAAPVAGPILTTPEDLVAQVQPGATTAAWTVDIDLSGVGYDASLDAIGAMAGLRSGLAELPTGDRMTSISLSGGSDILERARVAASSARAVLLVIAMMVTVLAAWSLAYTSRTLATARMAATALLRARGGPVFAIAAVSAMSVAAPAALVALAAPPFADVVLGAMHDRGLIASVGAADTGWLISIAAALGWLTMVLLADARGRSVVDVAVESARPSRRAVMQRAGLDVVGLALGALALQQLRRPVGDVPEIVLIVAPTVLVLAGTMMMIRLLPWCGRAASWLAAKARGVPSMLGSFEIARRPLRHTGPVAMFALALAAAVFIASTQATWSTFRSNAVTLAEPADVIIAVASVESVDSATAMAERSQQFATLPGVDHAMPVFRSAVRDDIGLIEIVGVDPAIAADVMHWPDDVAGGRPRELIDAMRDTRAGALLTRPYVEQLGLRVGDQTVLRVSGRSITITVAGVVAAVPGTAGAYAALVDQRIVRQVLADEVEDENGDILDLVPLPNQWWMAATDDGSAAASAAQALPGVTGSSTHTEAVVASEAEASYRGLIGGLGGGLVFAIVFGVVGMVLHAFAVYRSRSGEHSVLRAVGLRRWSTVVSVTTEQLLLIGFASVVGVGLGLAVSWTTVSQTVGRLAGLPDVPPLTVQTPWPVLVGLGVGTAALLMLIVVVASVALRRVRMTTVLRAGEQR